MKWRDIDVELLKQFYRAGTPCTWHVYALKDPLDGAVRYVGITYNPKQRLQGHQAERSDTRKSAWIAELRTRGLAPELHILESGDGGWSEQAECEQRWIAHYRPSGKLFNMTSGGECARGFVPNLTVTVTPEYSERRRAAIRKRKAAEPPYGVLPGEDAVVARIRALWNEGCGYLTVAKELSRDGFRTRYNGTWHPVSIKRVLYALGLETPWWPTLTEQEARKVINCALQSLPS